MDLAATILDAAKTPLGPGESLDGTSLRPLLEGKRPDRAPLFFHYPHYAWHRSNRPGGTIRSGRYKPARIGKLSRKSTPDIFRTPLNEMGLIPFPPLVSVCVVAGVDEIAGGATVQQSRFILAAAVVAGAQPRIA